MDLFLAQQCLCSWSPVNLAFLPNNLRLPGNVPPRQRPLVEGGSTRMEPLQMEREIAKLAA